MNDYVNGFEDRSPMHYNVSPVYYIVHVQYMDVSSEFLRQTVAFVQSHYLSR